MDKNVKKRTVRAGQTAGRIAAATFALAGAAALAGGVLLCVLAFAFVPGVSLAVVGACVAFVAGVYGLRGRADVVRAKGMLPEQADVTFEQLGSPDIVAILTRCRVGGPFGDVRVLVNRDFSVGHKVLARKTLAVRATFRPLLFNLAWKYPMDTEWRLSPEYVMRGAGLFDLAVRRVRGGFELVEADPALRGKLLERREPPEEWYGTWRLGDDHVSPDLVELFRIKNLVSMGGMCAYFAERDFGSDKCGAEKAFRRLQRILPPDIMECVDGGYLKYQELRADIGKTFRDGGSLRKFVPHFRPYDRAWASHIAEIMTLILHTDVHARASDPAIG